MRLPWFCSLEGGEFGSLVQLEFEDDGVLFQVILDGSNVVWLQCGDGGDRKQTVGFDVSLTVSEFLGRSAYSEVVDQHGDDFRWML